MSFMKHRIGCVWVAALLYACTATPPDAQRIVDRAIETAGGKKYLNSTIEFDFRDRHYRAQRDNGLFSYERIFKEGENVVHDILSNDGFQRRINGSPAEVPDTMKTKYSASVNSVIYFALLPYALNDPSVIKTYLGETVVEGKDFHQVKVTFRNEAGGEDQEDQFIYWFDKNNFTIGYLAYTYNEGKGWEYRFRKAINPRKVNGILFLDYINYKPKGDANLESLETLFKNGELDELSRIELQNIEVN
jgi:hypothetical protein